MTFLTNKFAILFWRKVIMMLIREKREKPHRCFISVMEKSHVSVDFSTYADTGLHNSWVRNNGTTQHNFCWFHCWVPINPHQLMFIKGWVPNISNQQLCNQQLVSIWSAWLLGTQLLGCAAFDPTLDQTFQILSLFVELVSKI